MQSTYSAKAGEISRGWYLLDASSKPLGRLAAEIARRLRGKHKPCYTPHVDTGDHVVVIHAAKVAVTGKKSTDKIYYRHSGYIGNLKKIRFEEMLAKHPARVIEMAVRGMLPKNALGRAMFRKLHVYAGDESARHRAQKPKVLEI